MSSPDVKDPPLSHDQLKAIQEAAAGRYLKGWQLSEAEGSVRPTSKGQFYVTSQSTPGKEYKLKPRLSNGYSCSCPDYATNYPFDHSFKCKHIICLEAWFKHNRDVRKYLEEKDGSLEKGLLVCPECESENVGPWGSSKGIACYRCKKCGHRFREENLLKYFVHEITIITLCLDLYFSGLSSRKISRNIRAHLHLKIHQSTIHRWIQKFIPIIMKYTMTLEPKLSDTWGADELFVKMRKGTDYQINKKKILKKIAFVWSVMDRKRKFLLASKLSDYRRASGGTVAFREAIKMAGESLPERVVTDGYKSYNPALRDAFHKNPVHHVRAGIKHSSHDEGYTVSVMERLQGTLRERVKVQRGWKSMKTALPDGMLIQYNYVNPHGGLSGMTPSDAVEIDLPGTDRWKTLIERGQRFKKQKEKKKKRSKSKGAISESSSETDK